MKLLLLLLLLFYFQLLIFSFLVKSCWKPLQKGLRHLEMLIAFLSLFGAFSRRIKMDWDGSSKVKTVGNHKLRMQRLKKRGPMMKNEIHRHLQMIQSLFSRHVMKNIHINRVLLLLLQLLLFFFKNDFLLLLCQFSPSLSISLSLSNFLLFKLFS